jgi:hypothetical protein
LIVATVGGPLIAAYSTGAITIPSGDDWDYSRVALHWAASGHLRLLGWEATGLIGHLLWGVAFATVFGPSLASLYWATALAAAVGLVAAYVVFRAVVDAQKALFATAAFAAFPTYPLLAATYMSDCTALALQLVCLALASTGLASRGSRRAVLLTLSLGAGVLGVTVRELGLAAVAAVVVGYAVVRRREDESIAPAVWVGLVCAGLVAAFTVWRATLHGAPVLSASKHLHLGKDVLMASQLFFALALSLLPASIVKATTLRLRHMSRTDLGVCIAVMAIGGVTVWFGNKTLLLGNYISPTGALADNVLSGVRPSVLGLLPWAPLTLCGLAGGMLLAVIITRTFGRPPDRVRWLTTATRSPLEIMLVVYGATTLGLILLRLGSGARVFDRYLWGATIAASGLLLARGPRHLPKQALTGGLAAIAVFALLSVVLVWNADSFNTARWKAGVSVSRLRVAADRTDAGFEWLGWHYRRRLGEKVPLIASPPRQWYFKLFPRATNCITVAASRLPQPYLSLLEVRRYSWLFGLGRGQLWIYQNRHSCPSITRSGR